MAALPTDRLTADLVHIYTEGERELEGLVAQAVASGALGTARYRNQQLAAVREVLRHINQQGVGAATSMVGSSYALGVKAVERSLRLPRTQFAGIHPEAVNVIADNIANRLNAATLNVGRKVEDAFRSEGLAHTARGLIAGSARREVSTSLAQGIADRGVRAFTAANGAEWQLGTYAQMVARTTTREAVTHGTANRLLEEGQDVVTISSHAEPCPICEPYDGETYSMTGATAGLDVLDELPPFHPNCEHVLGPGEQNFEAAHAALRSASTLEEAEKSVGIGANLATPPTVREAIQGAAQARAALRSSLRPPAPRAAPAAPASSGGTVQAAERVDFGPGAKTTHRPAIEEQLRHIDKVHGTPDAMPRVEVRVAGMGRGTLGSYQATGTLAGIRENIIRLSRAHLDPIPEAQAHEYGHFLDLHNFGRGPDMSKVIGKQYASAYEPELAGWRDAVKASPEYEALASSVDPGYLRSWRELFARAYEQYIADRAGVPELAAKHRRHAALPGYAGVYWSEESFKPIAEALDAFFELRGMKT